MSNSGPTATDLNEPPAMSPRLRLVSQYLGFSSLDFAHTSRRGHCCWPRGERATAHSESSATAFRPALIIMSDSPVSLPPCATCRVLSAEWECRVRFAQATQAHLAPAAMSLPLSAQCTAPSRWRSAKKSNHPLSNIQSASFSIHVSMRRTFGFDAGEVRGCA